MRDDDFNINDRDYEDREFRSNEYSEENLRDINDINDLSENSDKSKKVMFGAILFAILLIVIFVIYTTFFSVEEEKRDTAMEFLDESEPFFIDTPSPELELSSGFEEVPTEKFNKDELIEESYSDSSRYMEPVDEVVDRSEPTFEKRSEIVPEPQPPVVAKVETSSAPKQNHPTELVNDKKTYIQTGTFFKYQPNKKYLASIEALSLQYHIDTYISNGREITRVLVGPFDSYNSAKEMLPTVQEKIEKSSYLTTTKLH
ncbi:cell division protein [Thiovulum sp. ES]|nr:cell division protein [Thiovulum sp. ES]